MAEFTKKKRFLKYADEKCKKFLSIDFMQRCAYCRMREGDLLGPDSFEKDHFKPRSKGGTDDYENLYYACADCNGKAGKGDTWTDTLLDPCKDDIWGVHIALQENRQIQKITEQGEKYIKALRLNRRKYIERRRDIAREMQEYEERLECLRTLCEELIKKKDSSDMTKILQKAVEDAEKSIKYGANYRRSENAFDKEIDRKIRKTLSEIGKLNWVDRDYDLFYELQTDTEKFLCHTRIDEFDFSEKESVYRYLTDENFRIWKGINEKERILIITYNKNDKGIYVTEFDDIVKIHKEKKTEKVKYDILEKNKISAWSVTVHTRTLHFAAKSVRTRKFSQE